MMKKLIIPFISCLTLCAADAAPPSNVNGINLAMDVLKTRYDSFDDGLSRTIEAIEQVETELKQSDIELKQVQEQLKQAKQQPNVAQAKKLRLKLTEVINFLNSARHRLDIFEEKLNPIYWEPPTVGFIPDYSYDSTMKGKKFPIHPASKTPNIAPQKAYKFIIALFVMSLFSP